jgi:hypothetical protein
MRSGLPPLVTTLLLLVLALALFGCGTEGNAPPLGSPGHAILTLSGSGSSQASVLLTPFTALHVTVYYRGKQVPTSGALTPAQLRENVVQVFRALLENAASEQGARMSAMDNATRNAGEMIRKQTLTYNRTRQAMITKELIEIISGAEAL